MSCQTLARESAWRTEQVKHEMLRLASILRNPLATAEEKAIAHDQLAHWREMEAR